MIWVLTFFLIATPSEQHATKLTSQVQCQRIAAKMLKTGTVVTAVCTLQ